MPRVSPIRGGHSRSGAGACPGPPAQAHSQRLDPFEDSFRAEAQLAIRTLAIRKLASSAARAGEPTAKQIGSHIPQAGSRPRPPQGRDTVDAVEILDAALRAFARHGFDGMSVRTINRELGVSHNLIHQRFGSKVDLTGR